MRLFDHMFSREKNDNVPSILKQTKWPIRYVNFGKAVQPNIRFFNSSIIQRGDEEWIIARKAVGDDFQQPGLNSLVAFKLNDDRLPIFYVEIKLKNNSYRDQHFEDPRIAVISGQPWLSYCTFQVLPGQRWSGAHQQVAILNEEWQPSAVWSPVYGHNSGSLYTGTGNEKNWTWFEHDGVAHLVYHLDPMTVVRWNGDQVVEEYNENGPCTGWQWGNIRGGSNPVRIGDEYLLFYHSSTAWTPIKRRYHMGALCFEAKPPFKITRMTKKPLLSGSQDDPWTEGLPLVVFPCGAIYSRGKWVVTLGVNDYCTAMMEIPHGDLERLMT